MINTAQSVTFPADPASNWEASGQHKANPAGEFHKGSMLEDVDVRTYLITAPT